MRADDGDGGYGCAERELAGRVLQEHGALLFDELGIFAAPGFPLEDVLDPTGAGDSFAGGFVGFLAAHLNGVEPGSPDAGEGAHARADGVLSDDLLRRAMAHATVLASFNVEEFGTERVARLASGEIAGDSA